MAGRVEADAKYYKLPYEVLIGRGSSIIEDYQVTKLPRLLIVGKDGKVRFTGSYVPYDNLKEEVAKVMK